MKFKLEFLHEPVSSTWTCNNILFATGQIPDLEFSPAPSYQWLHEVERVSEGHRQRSWNREQDGDQGQGEYLGEDGVWGELGAELWGRVSYHHDSQSYFSPTSVITPPHPDVSTLLPHIVTGSSMTQGNNMRFSLFLAQWAHSECSAALGLSFLVNNEETLT